MFSTELVVQTFISGIMIGVLYALMALGITFIYSIMRMINWAMGEFYMIGSYLQYALVAFLLGPDLWWLAIPLSAAGVFVLGLFVQWGLLKPILRKPPEVRDDYATVVTLALLLLLRSLATGLAGPNQFSPGSDLPVVMVGPMPMAGARVAAFVFALAALALFYLLLRYSWYGLALRATSQSRVGVQTAGIDVLGVDRVAFGIGVALAGLAGALLAPVFLVYPTNGLITTVKGFEIVVIGGLGSIPGALIAGVLLGLIESFGAAFIDSAYQNIYGFALVLLILVLRPTGLFGERAREA
ncbi:branched-chain amino acid ABC transporter permease [Reyranella sp.]|jgi:branched-chain amino acid transport system permease protein|uniref:branched-chain amino acid ABC transporter permease n=1 Tax=Reyranella sp. TaxID=1929291 RepID=UPI002F945E20